MTQHPNMPDESSIHYHLRSIFTLGGVQGQSLLGNANIHAKADGTEDHTTKRSIKILQTTIQVMAARSGNRLRREEIKNMLLIIKHAGVSAGFVNQYVDTEELFVDANSIAQREIDKICKMCKVSRLVLRKENDSDC